MHDSNKLQNCKRLATLQRDLRPEDSRNICTSGLRRFPLTRMDPCATASVRLEAAVIENRGVEHHLSPHRLGHPRPSNLWLHCSARLAGKKGLPSKGQMGPAEPTTGSTARAQAAETVTPPQEGHVLADALANNSLNPRPLNLLFRSLKRP